MQLNPIGVMIVFICHAIAMVFLSPSRFKPARVAAMWCLALPVVVLLPFFIYRIVPNESGLNLGLCSTAAIVVSVELYLSAFDVSRTLFLFLTYSHMFVIILYVSIVLTNFYFAGSENMMITIRTVLHIGLIVLCLTAVRKKFYEFSSEIVKGWWPLNLVVFLLFINLSDLVVNTYTIEDAGTTLLPFFLSSVMTIAVYWLFFNTIRYMNIASRNEKIEMQSNFLMRQVENMQESIETARRIRHDARHHNLQIIEYAKLGEQEALLSYLGQCEREAESNAAVTLCENHAANSILNAYMRKAKQQGVEVRLDVSLEQNIMISDTDLVAMLANLMENAIHGCMQSKATHPFIDLYIGRKVSKLVVHIRNSAGDDVRLENGLPRTKNGVGVSSILHSAARYGGEYDFQVKDGIFSCQLLLKAPQIHTDTLSSAISD